jgi:Pyridoxamine 5'-phosphate oxidase
MASLTATNVALLGTLRRDGSPRISPVEPYLREGQLLIGAMAWSQKAADLRRDPRYVLHSVVTGPDNGEGEFKVYGSAAEASEQLRSAAAGAWWLAWPPGTAVVFALHIDQAVYITWDLEQGVMTVDRWSHRAGYSQSSRTYP